MLEGSFWHSVMRQLGQLGSHTTGVGCLYIKDLDKIDISVLESIVVESYGTVTADTYTLRAREEAAERSCKTYLQHA